MEQIERDRKNGSATYVFRLEFRGKGKEGVFSGVRFEYVCEKRGYGLICHISTSSRVG